MAKMKHTAPELQKNIPQVPQPQHRIPIVARVLPTTGDAVYVEYIAALLQSVTEIAFSKEEIHHSLEGVYDMVNNVVTRNQCVRKVAYCLEHSFSIVTREEVSKADMVFTALVRALAKKEGSFYRPGKVAFEVFLAIASEKYFKKTPLSKYEFAIFKLQGIIKTLSQETGGR